MAKYCENCGDPVEEGEVFCDKCGQRIEKAPELKAGESENGITGEKVTENIYLCADGKYRWYYEFPMMKNPTILFTTWKVFGISFGVVFLFMTVVDAFNSYDFLESFLGTLKIFGIIIGVFFLISLLAYFIVAASYGFKYIVIFTMDENEIVHEQCAKQFKKAQALGILTAIAGAASGNPSTVGLGIHNAVTNSMTSEYARVRSVKIRRRRGVIYVNQLLYKNQVYAYPEDFDFVADYIREHCPNAKIK